MKKIIALAILALTRLTAYKSIAQDKTFDRGAMVFSLGYGLPDVERINIRSYYSAYYYNGYYSNSIIRGFGPFMIKGDYGLLKFDWGHILGVGAVIGFLTTKASTNYTDWISTGHGNGYYANFTQKDRYTRLTVGARGSYHFLMTDKIDVYGNLGLGYNIDAYNQSTNDANGYYVFGTPYSGPSLYFALTAGIRYYLNDKIGLYSELGWDMQTPIQFGLSFKF